jgi:hypothetical protein
MENSPLLQIFLVVDPSLPVLCLRRSLAQMGQWLSLPESSPFPVQIQPPTAQSSSSLSKRDTSSQNVSGVVTGLFYDNGGRNVTILGGHFTATASKWI